MSPSPSQPKRQTKLGTWLWMGAGAFFLIGSLVMLILLFLSGNDLRASSLIAAKRIEFTPDFSHVEGKLLRLADITSGMTETPAAEEAAPKETTPEEAAPAEPAPIEPAPEGTPAPEASPPAPEEAPAEPAAPAETAPEEAAPAEAAPAEPAPAEAAAASEPAAPVELAPVQQQTAKGIIPVIAADGTKPWQYFAKKIPAPAAGKPRIAIVLYGLGLGSLATEAALALPPTVTLSFSPYSRNLNQWTDRARNVGHEILLDLPMETERYPSMDPGPYGVMNALGSAENYERLESVLTRAGGYVGLLMPLRETISANANAIGPLVDAMNKHGLILLSSDAENAPAFSEVTGRATSPILHADIVLDARIVESHIQSQLAQLEQLAQKQGFALAIGRSFPVTVEQVAEWSNTLAAKGITLVPVSALAAPPAPPAAP